MRARALAANGELAAATAAIEGCVDAVAGAGVPCLHVALLLDLARLLERAGDRAAAMVEARAAGAVLAGLDVVLPPRDVALLEHLGVQLDGGCGRQPSHTATLMREDRWWEAACGESGFASRHQKELRYLAELVANAGVEQHPLDLVDRVEGVAPASTGLAAPVDRRRLGDAGEMIDSQARAAYRRRVEALRSAIDDALAAGHDRRAEDLQLELDHIVAQLAQAFGLGGRGRRASSAAERARLNVTRALRSATAKVAQALPEPGAALDRRVRTGLYCAYEPHDDDEVRWFVHR